MGIFIICMICNSLYLLLNNSAYIFSGQIHASSLRPHRISCNPFLFRISPQGHSFPVSELPPYPFCRAVAILLQPISRENNFNKQSYDGQHPNSTYMKLTEQAEAKPI